MKLTDAVDLRRDEWNNLIDQYIFVDEHRKSSYLFTILLPSEKHPFAYSAGGCFSVTIKSENTGRNVYQNLAAKTPAFRHGAFCHSTKAWAVMN